MRPLQPNFHYNRAFHIGGLILGRRSSRCPNVRYVKDCLLLEKIKFQMPTIFLGEGPILAGVVVLDAVTVPNILNARFVFSWQDRQVDKAS